MQMAITAEIVVLLALAFQETHGLSAWDDKFAPSNVHFDATDFNLTLKWGPPKVPLLDGENILYTVFHIKEKAGNEEVSDCVNIMRTECHLLPIFPTPRDFNSKEIFFVTSASSIRSNFSGKSLTKGFTSRDIVASAPVIYNVSLTTTNITVWIRGPDTPFEKKGGRNLFLVEEAFRRGSFRLHLIYFNSSLMRDNIIIKSFTERKSPDGRAEIVYPNLIPYTNYTLNIQSKLNYKFSETVTTLKFRTKQTAPETGPIISGIEVIRRYCDFRDIKIKWEESARLRTNVALTKYVIDITDLNTTKIKNITVLASVQSVLLRKLNRWRQYNVVVTSFNSGGRKESEVKTIAKDVDMTRSYIPTIKDVVEVSPRERKLTWVTPKDHTQCIVGYVIEARTNEGSLEEKVYVDGFNTSSASLHLKKPGRYTIVLKPKFNDSIGTNVRATTVHDVKNFRYQEVLIFGGLALLIMIILIAMSIMTTKTFCNTSNLPDLEEIKGMKHSQDEQQPKRAALRKPPEKEVFHATRSMPPNHLIPSSYQKSEDAGFVFRAKSSSSSVLLDSNQSIHKDVLMGDTNDETSSQPVLNDAKGNQNQHINSLKDKTVCDLREDTSETTNDSKDKSWGPSLPDGYVAHSFSMKQQTLKVYIRQVSASLSSDSGFSPSPNSQSDYVPPSPFDDDSSYCMHTENPAPSHLEKSPYVTSELAEHRGRIPSSST